jgi:glutaredoxin
MNRVPLVTLYGKPGCHLCDDARGVVERVRAEHPFELREVDITLDPALHREYGERIPVLELDGEELFEFFVEEAVLVEWLCRVDGS